MDTMKQLLGPNAVSAIIGEGGMQFLSIGEYENLSIVTNYSKVSIDTDDQQHEWSTVDEYLDTIYGWFHGIIDPSNLDQDVIQRARTDRWTFSTHVPHISLHNIYEVMTVIIHHVMLLCYGIDFSVFMYRRSILCEIAYLWRNNNIDSHSKGIIFAVMIINFSVDEITYHQGFSRTDWCLMIFTGF